jgi:hypothetical protein
MVPNRNIPHPSLFAARVPFSRAHALFSFLDIHVQAKDGHDKETRADRLRCESTFI